MTGRTYYTLTEYPADLEGDLEAMVDASGNVLVFDTVADAVGMARFVLDDVNDELAPVVGLIAHDFDPHGDPLPADDGRSWSVGWVERTCPDCRAPLDVRVINVTVSGRQGDRRRQVTTYTCPEHGGVRAVDAIREAHTLDEIDDETTLWAAIRAARDGSTEFGTVEPDDDVADALIDTRAALLEVVRWLGTLDVLLPLDLAAKVRDALGDDAYVEVSR